MWSGRRLARVKGKKSRCFVCPGKGRGVDRRRGEARREREGRKEGKGQDRSKEKDEGITRRN